MKEDQKIVIYQTEDGHTQIDVRLENDTVWLTQAQMAELFQTDRTSIVRHINNIYKVEELDRDSTCAKIAQVQDLSDLWRRRALPQRGGESCYVALSRHQKPFLQRWATDDKPSAIKLD